MPSPPVPHPSTDRADLERLCALTTELLCIAGPDGVLLHVNRAWEDTLGWPVAELTGRMVLDFVHPDDVEATRRIMDAEHRRDGIADFENRYRTKANSWRTLRWRAHFTDGAWYAVAEDVTRKRQLERDVLRDPLTGVLNRTALFDRLAHALARADRGGKPVAVVFLDLDGFKSVNDSLGHALGDSVLSAVARRLDAALRRSDSLARLGGDEFVVLAEDVADLGVVEILVDRVRGALRDPLPAGDGTVSLGASIGVVLAHGGSANDILRQADVAMYRAKATGRNRAVWFDDQLRGEVTDRLELAADLRGAVAREELRLYVQPLVSLSDDAIVGCEALVRWQHPTRGLLAPELFLGIAEEDGDIATIGQWVLEQICLQQREWRRNGQELSVSFNVSARELADPHYAARVGRILQETGVDAVSLALEVTETALLRDTTQAARALGQLKKLGVRIVLDDFGRGYSSLEHVKSLPVDVVKVDRGFIAGLGHNDEDRAIVAAIVALARTTGLTVIAEGVETGEQLRVLRELGCPIAQGHYFAPAAPAAELQLDGFLPHGLPGVGDPFVIREFMRQIGIPARIR